MIEVISDTGFKTPVFFMILLWKFHTNKYFPKNIPSTELITVSPRHACFSFC